MKSRLGPEEWLDVGLKTLMEQGVEAVRVERLATALGVTKGSFYWHFKDRRAFLMSLLDTWKARATTDIIQQVEKRGGDGAARFRSLFAIAFDSDGRMDTEIRAWAAKDPSARNALEDIDERRLDYLEHLYRSMGFEQETAAARSRFVYLALIGHYRMSAAAKEQYSQPEQFERMVEMLLDGRSQNAG